MSEIKAIETHYKGYRFRSRLEARWAVYFDAEGIPWEYEKEGYCLGELGFYLPDFWFPEIDMWAEVKSGVFSEIEQRKCLALAQLTGFPVLMLDGLPSQRNYWAYHSPFNHPFELNDYYVDGSYLNENRFYSCTGVGELEIEFNKNIGSESSISKALSARFEHGEKP